MASSSSTLERTENDATGKLTLAFDEKAHTGVSSRVGVHDRS